MTKELWERRDRKERGYVVIAAMHCKHPQSAVVLYRHLSLYTVPPLPPPLPLSPPSPHLAPPQARDGTDGIPGTDGRDGTDGAAGFPGEDVGDAVSYMCIHIHAELPR